MHGTKHPTKQERRRSEAERRKAVRLHRERRRRLAYVSGGVALVAALVLVGIGLLGNEETVGVGPAAPGEVTADAARTEPLGPGDAVPGFEAPAIGGGTVRWSDFSGGPVVISVWAPWCPHCQVELPILDRVMEDFPQVSFVTIVTSIGTQPGPAPDVFLAENDLTAPTAIDDEAGTMAAAFGIRAFPSLYFVSSDGTIVRFDEGEVAEAELREIIGSLG